jgi:aryl-alcohol dehydrogenase-like predicted oxidoreductase
LIPWSPLKAGVLAGLDKAKEGRRTGELAQRTIDKHLERLERFDGFCRELGERSADVALAWLLKNPAVTAPIIGPRTLEQLDESLRALEVDLDSAALGRLDEIFPGPGGPAPEAYAW